MGLFLLLIDFITAHGKRTDATQEMIALGVGTILGSFFGSMPVTASFGRSAVQSSSRAKTPFTNVYGGALFLQLKLTY